MHWLTGSQCSCFRTGLMWSYFLVRVIMQATAFWTFCKRSIRKVGSPCNSELALSSLEVMNAWTSFSVSTGDKQSLILLMFLRWKKQALQVLVTCLSSHMCSSKITPISLALQKRMAWSVHQTHRCILLMGVGGAVRLGPVAPFFLCSGKLIAYHLWVDFGNTRFYSNFGAGLFSGWEI